MLTQDKLREHLSYDAETGEFRWLIAGGGRSRTKLAGTTMPLGYRRIRVLGREYLAHHLAWLYVHGELPKEMDHINGDKADNRLSNLRLATRTENMRNRRGGWGMSGLKGVSLRSDKRLVAKIKYDGKNRSLGAYDTPEEAHAAYCVAAQKAFGEFARGS
jgi:hypothetical protein